MKDDGLGAHPVERITHKSVPITHEGQAARPMTADFSTCTRNLHPIAKRERFRILSAGNATLKESRDSSRLGFGPMASVTAGLIQAFWEGLDHVGTVLAD